MPGWMTWSFVLLLERTLQQSKSLRASAETTVRGRMAWPWFRGSLGIAPLGTWPSSTHSRHHMSHRALCRPEAQRQLLRTGRSPSTATCHPATCFFLWLSRLLAHWLMMDTRSFGRLARALHYALLIRGKPLFSTNASWLRFSDLTQYAWPTHFQFSSHQGNHSRDFTNCLVFTPLGMKYQWAKKIIIITRTTTTTTTTTECGRVIREFGRSCAEVWMKGSLSYCAVTFKIMHVVWKRRRYAVTALTVTESTGLSLLMYVWFWCVIFIYFSIRYRSKWLGGKNVPKMVFLCLIILTNSVDEVTILQTCSDCSTVLLPTAVECWCRLQGDA